MGGQWGVGLEVLGGERMEKALISAESTTKTVLFTLKRKGIASFLFFFYQMPIEQSVMSSLGLQEVRG